MKVCIYVRVSTDEQELTNQLESCQKYCETNKYEIYKIYQDVLYKIAKNDKSK